MGCLDLMRWLLSFIIYVILYLYYRFLCSITCLCCCKRKCFGVSLHVLKLMSLILINLNCPVTWFVAMCRLYVLVNGLLLFVVLLLSLWEGCLPLTVGFLSLWLGSCAFKEVCVPFTDLAVCPGRWSVCRRVVCPCCWCVRPGQWCSCLCQGCLFILC